MSRKICQELWQKQDLNEPRDGDGAPAGSVAQLQPEHREDAVAVAPLQARLGTAIEQTS